MTFRAYLRQIIVALDALGQLLLPRSIPGITISTRAYTGRFNKHWWWTWLADSLDFFFPNHCYKALLADRARAQAVLDNLKDY